MGIPPVLSDSAELPDLLPETVEAGRVALEPGTCTFFVLS